MGRAKGVGGGPLLTFRVQSRDEIRQIQRAAVEAGVSRSTYIRSKLGLLGEIGRNRDKKGKDGSEARQHGSTVVDGRPS
jgi:hypothetical protein